MTPTRVYPARIAARERKLLAAALAALSVPVRQDSEEVRRAISHRLACADRYDEMRERRLSADERDAVTVALLAGVRFSVEIHDPERARANARALVRLTR